MAVTRKGWRPLDVGGTAFVWRATGTDDGIAVTVTTPSAFVRGPRERQLCFTVPHGVAIVTPGVVRRAIELVGRDGEGPGEPGPDVVLWSWAARAIAVDAPARLLPASVARVDAWRRSAGAGSGWGLASGLLDLGALLVLAPALREDPAARGAWTPGEALAAARALVAESEAVSRRDPRFHRWRYLYRSAAAWIVDLAAPEVGEALGDTLAALDAHLQSGPPRRESVPHAWLLPASHAWMRWAPG